MKKMRDGARVLIPCVVDDNFKPAPIRALQRARAYRSSASPSGWMAYSNNGHVTMWLEVHEEGILWCRDWSGPTARALKAARALQ